MIKLFSVKARRRRADGRAATSDGGVAARARARGTRDDDDDGRLTRDATRATATTGETGEGGGRTRGERRVDVETEQRGGSRGERCARWRRERRERARTRDAARRLTRANETNERRYIGARASAHDVDRVSEREG